MCSTRSPATESRRCRDIPGGCSTWGFDSSGGMLVSGAGDGTVRVWRLGNPGEILSIDIGVGYKADAGIDVHGQTGVALVYPGERETLFSEFFSTMTRFAIGELVIFDTASGVITHRVAGTAGKVARISPDGSAVAVQSATQDGIGNILVLDLETGETVYELPGLCTWRPGTGDTACGDLVAADATDLAWSADGQLLAMAGGSADALIVWNVGDQKVVFQSPPHERDTFPFSAVAFSPDGTFVAVSSKSGMWIYNTTSWELVTPLITHTGRPSWVMQFTSDSSELITAQAHSGDVRIYETATWTERDMRGGPAQTRDMAVSDDQTLIALADRAGNIHVLDFETGDLLELISLEDRDITNIEFIDGNQHLLISSATGPVEILTLNPAELIDIAKSRITRSFTAAECEFYDLHPCPSLDELRRG